MATDIIPYLLQAGVIRLLFNKIRKKIIFLAIFCLLFVIVKEEPQKIITRPKDSLSKLVKYMNDQGFIMTEQMGATVFLKKTYLKKYWLT